jgi:hypothetical protein
VWTRLPGGVRAAVLNKLLSPAWHCGDGPLAQGLLTTCVEPVI